MKRTVQWDVRGAVALLGVFHFLRSCADACLLPFLTLYLRHLGLAASMAAVVMGTKHLVATVWCPLSSLLAKHYSQRRAVVMASLLGAAGASLILLLIPPSTVSQHCNVTHLGASVQHESPEDASPYTHLETIAPTSGSATTLAFRSPAQRTLVALNWSTTSVAPLSRNRTALYAPNQHSDALNTESKGLDAASNSSMKDTGSISERNSSLTSFPDRKGRSLESVLEAEPEAVGHYEFLGSLKDMEAPQQRFFLVLMAVALWEALAAPLTWTVDDGLYEYLDFVDATDRYGSAHVWGLLGAAGGACGVGIAVSSLNCLIGVRLPRSSVHFFSYALVMAFALPVAAFLPMYRSRKREPGGRALKALQLLRGDGRALLCAATAFLVGAASSGVDNFLLWQMQDHGSNELHMGVALGVALLSQLLFCLLSSRVSKVLNHSTVLTVGTGCLGLQCLYYSFLWSPWSVLPAQTLSGLSAAAFRWAVQQQCADVATPEMERSMCRVFHTLTVSLGLGVGSFAGGLVVERFGAAVLFRASAVALLPWCLLLPVAQSRIPHQRRINYSQLLAVDVSEVSESESDQERDWLVKAMKDDRSNNNR